MFNHLYNFFPRLSYLPARLNQFKKLARPFSLIAYNNAFANKETCKIRKIEQEELKLIIKWATQEGWNPGLHESEALYTADPGGYYLLEIDNKPIASLGGIHYSTNFSFLGLYIVKPSCRGLGYGKLLWDHVLNNLRDSQGIGLNGVESQIGKYKQEGFKLAYPITRFIGKPLKCLPVKDIGLPFKIKSPANLLPIIDYETRLFPATRILFLAKWFTMPDSHVLAAYHEEKLCGYGVISKTINGFKIAPLVADTLEIAEHLYYALCHYADHQCLVQLDTPTDNPAAPNLAQKLGLNKQFNTYRMYKGNVKEVESAKQFGVTSLEIG